MTMDVISVIVNIVVKVLLINLMTKRCRRCRPRNIPSGKKNQGKEGGNLPPQRQKIMANASSWWRCLCCFTGTEERDEPTNNYTVIPFLSLMPCINILFLLFLFMIFEATSRDTSCTYFYLRYCRFPLVFEVTKNLRNNEENAQIIQPKWAARRELK